MAGVSAPAKMREWLQVYENIPGVYAAFFDAQGTAAQGLDPLQLRSSNSFKVLGEVPLQGGPLVSQEVGKPVRLAGRYATALLDLPRWAQGLQWQLGAHVLHTGQTAVARGFTASAAAGDAVMYAGGRLLWTHAAGSAVQRCLSEVAADQAWLRSARVCSHVPAERVPGQGGPGIRAQPPAAHAGRCDLARWAQLWVTICLQAKQGSTCEL